MQTVKQPNLAFEYQESNTAKYSKYIVSIITALSLMVAPVVYLKHKENNLKVSVVRLQAEYDKLVDSLSKNPIDINALSSEVDGLNSEYSRLTQENYHLTTRLFDQIEQSLPKTVWLTDYTFNRNTFNLKGMAKDVNELEQFFNNLGKEYKNLKIKVNHGTEYYEFEISTAQETK